MMLLLFLMQITCLPTDWQYPPELRGCDQIYKREDSQVQFDNGYSEYVIQGGTGQCTTKTACNPLEYELNGILGLKEQCWPQFKDPERSPGKWSRTVENAQIVVSSCGACYESVPDSIPFPMVCPRCVPNGEDTVEVKTTCDLPGDTTLGPGNPFDWGYPQPCSWTFLPGVRYCGDEVNK